MDVAVDKPLIAINVPAVTELKRRMAAENLELGRKVCLRLCSCCLHIDVNVEKGARSGRVYPALYQRAR
jgi:hypothetical protein